MQHSGLGLKTRKRLTQRSTYIHHNINMLLLVILGTSQFQYANICIKHEDNP